MGTSKTIELQGRVQDDGHRFGALSPLIPLIVSDRGTPSIAHH
jgi:hypothetical protein